MRSFSLDSGQLQAVKKMKNGCILCGGVGSGKSRTAISYYCACNGSTVTENKCTKMKRRPMDLYIITTAKKRDSHEWEDDLRMFMITPDEELAWYKHKVVVDSWNNIKKYENVVNSFFMFDEQRAVGSGVWSKTFIAIAKKNQWIMLSATPGDTWMDYIPVFIANGFYKNRYQFEHMHVVFNRYVKFKQVDRYLDTDILEQHRQDILVELEYERATISHYEVIECEYDKTSYRNVSVDRWNPYTNKPIINASELCYTLRRIVNTNDSRFITILDLLKNHPKIIIFYNFNYELDILKEKLSDYTMAEWNGHKHEEVPTGDSWVYLVQYTAGAEGWNCITTDTMIFYSQNYSYKIVEQAEGRINRRNTPYKDLYYYHLVSTSKIDLAISRALKTKKNFNESKFIKW